ncbi:MAG: FAD-dependent oxidoreductase, partial [Hyphomicrobiales bacterium]|nr:FAD-dependent oxidoreductase [Hyphomicrobiales bacterium]
MSKTRNDKLGEIVADGAFDAIVVGGGINGIGVYRELALQGLRVLLVERSDFCSGCSAAPSRMIHGGLRYLENGEFSLVGESLSERDGLLATAPHFVRPLATTIPIIGVFSGLWNSAVSFLGGSSKPSNRGAVPIRLGLGVYDWLTRKRRIMARHSFRGRNATRRLWPQLNSRVRFSATYYDAWISHPERLGIELVADAEEIAPACAALNYATLDRGMNGDLVLVDGTTGVRTTVTAKVIINATGAWLDETRSELADSDTPGERLVAGTKGSHLVIDSPALLKALGGHMLYFENADGRICIAFPYLGRVLAGATDIRV